MAQAQPVTTACSASASRRTATADDLPEGQVTKLDQAILRRKHRLLRDPVSREAVFAKAKSLLSKHGVHGVIDKLDALINSAEAARRQMEELLAQRESGDMTEEERSLLYTAEESEEFE